MTHKQKFSSFMNKGWVSLIGVFILSQLLFILSERIGWHPRFRDINSQLLNNFMDSALFREQLSFYEQPQYNLLTIFFVVVGLIPGIIGGIREAFRSKSRG